MGFTIELYYQGKIHAKANDMSQTSVVMLKKVKEDYFMYTCNHRCNLNTKFGGVDLGVMPSLA
jgi:hypothetical protein